MATFNYHGKEAFLNGKEAFLKTLSEKEKMLKPAFSSFPTMLPTLSQESCTSSATLILWSAIAFNLDILKILSSGKSSNKIPYFKISVHAILFYDL